MTAIYDETLSAMDERFSLFALACVLTDDAKRAETLVRRTIAGGSMSFAGPGGVRTRDVAREFARRLYLGFREDGDFRCRGDVEIPGAEGMLDVVRRLPDQQREVFALCAFGGHTSRQAGILLGIAEDEADELLNDSLQVLDAEL